MGILLLKVVLDSSSRFLKEAILKEFYLQLIFKLDRQGNHEQLEMYLTINFQSTVYLYMIWPCL